MYQKSKLKKSFVRILFYDSRDIKTQKLLFYSTIFLDTGVLYGKYVNNIETYGYVSNNGNSGMTGIDVNYEYNPSNEEISFNENKRLSTRLTIRDKYNTDSCSEGFYLYLFNSNLPMYIPNNIYMKIEYNHAGYGRTIPFIMPTDNLNYPIEPINNKDFPISYKEYIWNEVDDSYTGDYEVISEEDYENKNGDENKVYLYGNKKYILGEDINIKKLYSDLYIQISVKYDFDTNQFVWFLPRKFGYNNGFDNNNVYNGKLVFNLFEPKIQ